MSQARTTIDHRRIRPGAEEDDGPHGFATGSAEAGLRIEPFRGVVTVTFSDAIIASTDRALILHEPGHDPVPYIPFEDIYFEFLERSDTQTRCPRKGTASYWRVSAVGEAAEDFMWSYETPHEAAKPIAGHGAFDTRIARIEIVPEDDAAEPRLL